MINNFINKETKLKMYNDIWSTLNQNDLIQIKSESTDESRFIFSHVKEYFEKSDDYKFIHLNSIKLSEKQYLESKQISLNKVIENFKKAIYENEQKTSADSREFQIRAIEEKFIYAICPFRGGVIKSNQSIALTHETIFYRFSSVETFYIVTTHLGSGYEKGAIYFPNHELIIKHDHEAFGLTKKHILQFKALLTCNFKDYYQYFSSKDNKKVAIIFGAGQFAHEIWNELSGLYRLHQAGCFHKIDKFFVIRDTLGPVSQIFPEIPADRIKYVIGDESIEDLIPCEIVQEIVNENYFVVNVGDIFIKDDLTNRIYEVAVNNSSSEVIAKVNEARKKHFPLLWISIREDNRTWINQVDGLSKIIISLAEFYPRLGVVFDGFSIPADFFSNPHLAPENFGIKTITRQNEIVKQIIDNNLSSLEIGIFNTVGCSIWETNLWAHAIDVYLAHYGTIQHKVGWLANKPGIIHSNKKVLKESYDYMADVREFGLPLIYVNHIHARDIILEDEKIKSDPRNNLNNYDIDWKILLKEILTLSKLIGKEEKLLIYLNSRKRSRKIIPYTINYIKQRVKRVLKGIVRLIKN